jgi:hypothetical protein
VKGRLLNTVSICETASEQQRYADELKMTEGERNVGGWKVLVGAFGAAVNYKCVNDRSHPEKKIENRTYGSRKRVVLSSKALVTARRTSSTRPSLSVWDPVLRVLTTPSPTQ